MKTTQNIAGLLLLALTGMVASCSSTEVIEPAQTDETISISVSAPDAYKFPVTRADATVQLRYTAKLYSGSAVDPDAFVERKELLASAGSTITFNVKKQGNYFITLFADYVDANASANADGCYPDKYYDTSSTGDYVYMLALKPDEGSKTYAESPINNDNFDCYAATVKVAKKGEEVNQDVILNHAVCKVNVLNKVTEDDDPEGIDQLNITSFSFIRQYSMTNKVGYATGSKISGTPIAFAPNNLSTGEMFYFYTFGSNNGKIEIAFEIQGKDGFTYNPVSIAQGVLIPAANTIINVRGSFLVPSSAPDKPKDNINITVSAGDWSSTESNKDL